jgi:hypothetical protein
VDFAWESAEMDMELIWSLGLLVGLMLALNFMAGGRSSSVLGPVRRITATLVSMAIRMTSTLLGSVLRLGPGAAKLPKIGGKLETDRGGKIPPTRWTEAEVAARGSGTDADHDRSEAEPQPGGEASPYGKAR